MYHGLLVEAERDRLANAYIAQNRMGTGEVSLLRSARTARVEIELLDSALRHRSDAGATHGLELRDEGLVKHPHRVKVTRLQRLYRGVFARGDLVDDLIELGFACVPIYRIAVELDAVPRRPGLEDTRTGAHAWRSIEGILANARLTFEDVCGQDPWKCLTIPGEDLRIRHHGGVCVGCGN